jgi:predicted dehydrogenase
MMSENEKNVLRIGLLGCGPIAQFAHLPALAKAKRVRLTAICDAADDLLLAIGRQTGVEELYTSYEKMLAEAPIDAVLIAAADAFHVSLATLALQAGKHVLVEKPLGTSSAECMPLVALVKHTGLKFQVGSMKRHDPGVAEARRFIQEELGDVLSLSGWYCDTLFRPALQEALLPPVVQSKKKLAPRVDPKADNRHYSLVTHGAHLFDTLRHLGGPISAVTVRLAEKTRQYTWHGLLELAGGGLGHFELTVKVNADWSEGYRVYGEHGSVEVETFLPFYHRPSRVRLFSARRECWQSPLGAHSNAYKNQLEAFAAAALDDQPTNPGVADGLAAVRLLEAVEQSVAEGRRVEIENS